MKRGGDNEKGKNSSLGHNQIQSQILMFHKMVFWGAGAGGKLRKEIRSGNQAALTSDQQIPHMEQDLSIASAGSKQDNTWHFNATPLKFKCL